MYWRFINLRIIIELCGFIVVFWFVELWSELDLAIRFWATSSAMWLSRRLPRGCHVVYHVAATSSATWLPCHLPRGLPNHQPTHCPCHL
jgi:hypothetical protein